MDPQHKALLEALMHARSTGDCTLPLRADNLDGNGSGSAGCGAYVGIADQGYEGAFLRDRVHPYIATGQELMDSAPVLHVTGCQLIQETRVRNA